MFFRAMSAIMRARLSAACWMARPAAVVVFLLVRSCCACLQPVVRGFQRDLVVALLDVAEDLRWL